MCRWCCCSAAALLPLCCCSAAALLPLRAAVVLLAAAAAAHVCDLFLLLTPRAWLCTPVRLLRVCTASFLAPWRRSPASVGSYGTYLYATLQLPLSSLHQRDRRRFVLSIDLIDCCSPVLYLFTRVHSSSTHAERTRVLVVLHVVLVLHEQVMHSLLCRMADSGCFLLCLRCFISLDYNMFFCMRPLAVLSH